MESVFPMHAGLLRSMHGESHYAASANPFDLDWKKPLKVRGRLATSSFPSRLLAQ